jgi:GT2 family glycosyltransferase
VEQSIKEEVKASLPNWVRYIHTPLPRPDLPYCRSWALNVGAREAKGKVLILHDNDFLVPVDYASDVLSKFNSGNEVIQPKRFMFYLSQKGTERIFAKHVKGFINQHDSNNCCHREDRRDAAISSFKNKIASPPAEARNDAMPKGLMAAHEISFRLIIQIAPERIVQNLEAGGSIAVGRDAYFAIGGFDESFIGWGGEDNEFWDRAQTRKVCPYGFLPLVHLWHPGQPDKHYVGGQGRYTGELFENKMKMGREERTKELILLDFGNPRAL